jgi:hypothetical protein
VKYLLLTLAMCGTSFSQTSSYFLMTNRPAICDGGGAPACIPVELQRTSIAVSIQASSTEKAIYVVEIMAHAGANESRPWGYQIVTKADGETSAHIALDIGPGAPSLYTIDAVTVEPFSASAKKKPAIEKRHGSTDTNTGS